MQDKDIVALFVERDEQALEQTQAVYGAYCRAVAMRLLQNSHDAEECVNDAFWRTWNTIPPANPENLRAYLAKIVRHLAFDRYKSQTAVKRGGGELPLVLDELAECLPDGNEDKDVTESILLKDCLERFLSHLSVDKRYIFLRRYWYTDSVKEIATATGKSESNIRITLSLVYAPLSKLYWRKKVSIYDVRILV